MPMQEAGESQQPGPTRDSLIREADLNGFLGSLQFNEFGHCLVSRFVGCCCEIYHIPASFYQQWPKLLLHGYGLGIIGPAAKEAIPILSAVTNGPTWWVRNAAQVALMRIKGES